MSGGYISCGDFHGEDKSGSAIAGVFDELIAIMPDAESERFAGEVTKAMQDQLKQNGDHFLIDSEIARLIQPGIESLFARFKSHFGGMEAWEAPDVDHREGVDPIEAKWGKGVGWQYYCVNDLRLALRRCIETGEPVCISFD